MAQEILLEAGTNEMEILIFRLGETSFGINVAKVREIIQRPKTISIPNTPHAVEGSFKLRDEVLTLINIGRHFNMEGQETQNGRGMIIIVEFNTVYCGILVDAVEVIHRLSWDTIASPSYYLACQNVPVTGIVSINDKTILIVDFETVVEEILGIPGVNLPAASLPNSSTDTSRLTRILLADDSHIIRKTLTRFLRESGFENLIVCNDGRQAWQFIQDHHDQENGPCDIVLTDVEMPGMDGLHLTKKIKDDPQLENIPVILFSSLVTQDNFRKGQAVGADAQISKSKSHTMLKTIEELLAKSKTGSKEPVVA